MKWKKGCAVLLAVALACMQLTAFAVAFSDVDENYGWARDAIDSFVAQGIVVGKGENLFAPEDLVTREEVAKMLCLAFDIDLQKPDTPSFSDVPADRWSYEYIESSKDYVIRHATFYEPEEPATRLEITSAIVNALGLTAEDEAQRDYAKTVFSDVEAVGYPNLEKISLAALYGLVEGYEDGIFGPDKQLTRAEAVVMLKRAQDKAAELVTPTPSPAASAVPTATAEPTATPVPSETPDSLKPSISQFAMVMSVTKASVDGETCYKLYYNIGGEPIDEPVIVREDVTVAGGRESIDALACGDMILASYDNKDRVKAICVILAPGVEAPAQGEEEENFFQKMLYVPNQSSWYVSGVKDSALDEVYYGYIGRVTGKNDNYLLTLLGGDGNFGSEAAQTFVVPVDTNVVRYTASSSMDAASRFKNVTTADIEASYFPENEDGNVDFTSEEFRMKDMRFAFVHLYRGEVKDVVLIDYNR